MYKFGGDGYGGGHKWKGVGKWGEVRPGVTDV